MTDIKLGTNGNTKTISVEKDEGVYPSPVKVRKAELAQITFDNFTALWNTVERLEKELIKLKNEI